MMSASGWIETGAIIPGRGPVGGRGRRLADLLVGASRTSTPGISRTMRYCCAMPTLKHCLQFDNDQPPARRAALRILAALALFVLIAAPPVRAEPPREHQIKAAFVYNFLQFIRWPDGAFKDDKA